MPAAGVGGLTWVKRSPHQIFGRDYQAGVSANGLSSWVRGSSSLPRLLRTWPFLRT
jgi:hypothetical protein